MMKTRTHIRLLIVAFLLLGALSGCATAATPTPTPQPTPEPTVEAQAADEVLVVTGEFPPFTSESLEGGGISTEIVTAVFAQMGVPVRVEFYPWERAERMVEDGEAWAAFPYVPTEDRRARFEISDTLSYARTMWFYFGEPREIAYSDLNELEPYRIGVSLGYWYIPILEEAGLTLDEGTDDVANLRKLEAARIDLFPIHEYIAAWLIQENFPEQGESFRMIETPLDVSPDALIVSRAYPNSAEILEQFNAALATIYEDGTYEAVFARYGITPFIPESETSGS